MAIKRSRGSQEWLVLILVALVMTISGCAIHYTNVSGMERNRRVVDKETGIGVPEALVVFQWDENRVGFGANTTFCTRVSVLKTGPDGGYMTPDWNGRVPMVNRIYKRGYVSVSDDVAMNRGIDYITKSGKAGIARIEEINNYLIRCGNGDERKLLEYYRALYDEFRTHLPHGQSIRIEEEYIYSIDLAQFGRDEADRRLQERLQPKKGSQ